MFLVGSLAGFNRIHRMLNKIICPRSIRALEKMWFRIRKRPHFSSRRHIRFTRLLCTWTCFLCSLDIVIIFVVIGSRRRNGFLLIKKFLFMCVMNFPFLCRDIVSADMMKTHAHTHREKERETGDAGRRLSYVLQPCKMAWTTSLCYTWYLRPHFLYQAGNMHYFLWLDSKCLFRFTHSPKLSALLLGKASQGLLDKVLFFWRSFLCISV